MSLLKKITVLILLCTTPLLLHSNPTAGSQQMVLALADNWTSTTGSLQRFQRAANNDKWQHVGEKIPVAFGMKGLGWGIGLHDKHLAKNPIFKKGPRVIEGSKRAPAGVFSLNEAFGKPKITDARAQNIKLDYTQVTPHEWGVDDIKSSYYNRITNDQRVTKDWNSAEDMHHFMTEGLYEYGIVIEHNYAKPIPGKGSCFFLHVHRAPGKPTPGCTVFAREQVIEVLQWLAPQKKPILVQMPVAVFNNLKAGWDLPNL